MVAMRIKDNIKCVCHSRPFRSGKHSLIISEQPAFEIPFLVELSWFVWPVVGKLSIIKTMVS